MTVESPVALKRPKRRYSDRERGEALAVFDSVDSAYTAGKLTGIPANTITAWQRDGRAITPDALQIRAQKNSELASKFSALADRALEILLSANKLADVSPRDLTVIAGIATDKHLLLTGQPTSIQEHTVSTMSADERADRLAGLLAQARDRAALPAGDTIQGSLTRVQAAAQPGKPVARKPASSKRKPAASATRLQATRKPTAGKR